MRNGRVLTRSGGAILARAPRYLKLWGYYQAQHDSTTEPHDWAAVYDWIYECFAAGLSAGQRELEVGGQTYEFETDGGIALVGGDEYKPGFRKLVVPMISFAITNNTDNSEQVSRVITQVLRDNQALSYYKVGYEVNQVNGAAPAWQVNYGGRIGYFSIIVPNDTLRAEAQARIAQAVMAIKAKVKEVTGYSVADARGWTAADWKKRRNVVKVIHDWMMEHTNYKDSEDNSSKYWSQTAYATFAKQDGIFPVCAGYSSALVYVCNLYGINAVYVGGGTNGRTGGHAWTLLSLLLPMGDFSADATKWAAIDLTWDDGVYDRYYELQFSSEKTYAQGQQVVYAFDGWECHTDITTPGAWTGEDNWVQLTHSGLYSSWWCFAVDGMYTRDGRNNGARGFPVSAPGAYYPYRGTELYGISEADWTAPQGGGAV